MPVHDDVLPRPFGPYILVASIGTGGMAEVLFAVRRGAGDFEKPLAIKRIRAEMTSPTFVEMFETEARLSAPLNHPAIAQVYDFGEADGTPYIAMEWVDGKPLRHVLRRLARLHEPFPLELCLYIVRAMCGAVHYAHTVVAPDGAPAAVLHCDLSPANILLSYQGHVKIVDFGIARAMAAAGHQIEGPVRGTKCYVSPELVSLGSPSVASDIFALGVVLFEMLTLTTLPAAPVPGSTVSETWNRPSRYREGVPPALDAIVLRATAARVEDRFRSMSEFEDALSELDVAGVGSATCALALQRWFRVEHESERETFREGLELARALLGGAPRRQVASPWATDPRAVDRIYEGALHAVRSRLIDEGAAKRGAPDDVTGPLGTVLVVDDEVLLRTAVARQLGSRGFQVVVAGDGREAMDRVSTEDVDVLLMDIEMPVMSGLEALGRLRESYTLLELPIIMATGLGATQDVVEALRVGANDYVVKPLELGVVEARLKTQLMVKFTHEALRRTEDRYAALAENAPDLVFILSPEGTFQYVSPASWTVLGYQPGEIVGRAEMVFIHPDDRDIVAESVASGAVSRQRFRMLHNEGRFVLVEAARRTLRGDGGEIVRIQGSIRNVEG